MHENSSSTLGEDVWDAADFFGDESSFYGDEDMKADCERRVQEYVPDLYWEGRHLDLQYVSCKNQKKTTQPPKAQDPELQDTKPAIGIPPACTGTGEDHMRLDEEAQDQHSAALPELPYNPYKDITTAYQLDESLSNFLERLPPRTTTLAQTSQPWIWIAYPYSSHRLTDPDIKTFRQDGRTLLDEYFSRKRKLEEQNPSKAAGAITRMLKADRLWLEEAIVKLAMDKKVLCGKWMLFVYANQANEIWAKVANATLEGRLGCSAKVGTDEENPQKPDRLICVYTKDFSDMADVHRTLMSLKSLGLAQDGEGKKPIYYKCDAYTHLDIMNGNEYKLKASMYNSVDLVKEMARSH